MLGTPAEPLVQLSHSQPNSRRMSSDIEAKLAANLNTRYLKQTNYLSYKIMFFSSILHSTSEVSKVLRARNPLETSWNTIWTNGLPDCKQSSTRRFTCALLFMNWRSEIRNFDSGIAYGWRIVKLESLLTESQNLLLCLYVFICGLFCTKEPWVQ